MIWRQSSHESLHTFLLIFSSRTTSNISLSQQSLVMTNETIDWFVKQRTVLLMNLIIFYMQIFENQSTEKRRAMNLIVSRKSFEEIKYDNFVYFLIYYSYSRSHCYIKKQNMKHGRLKSRIRKYSSNNFEIFCGSEAFELFFYLHH